VGLGVRVLLSLLVTAGIVVAAFFGLTQRFTEPNDAMEPTVKKGDHVAVFRFEDTFNSPSRKDIVVVEAQPTGACFSKSYVMRIVGLPGETVTERDGSVAIDGTPLAEPYVKPAQRGNGVVRTLKVPPDAYLVLGDNRRSRCWSPGFVPKKDIVGTAFLTFWPADRVSVN
jgi:signal peptidase I